MGGSHKIYQNIVIVIGATSQATGAITMVQSMLYP